MQTAERNLNINVRTNTADATGKMTALAKSEEAVISAQGRLALTTRQSQMHLQSMSRIVQDMPFGFMAVGNNITFMAEQMAYAKEQGASFKQMLGGMASSFMGPGGIIFAISAVTSLITYFSMHSSSATKTTDKHTEALKKQRLELQKLRDEYAKLSLATLYLSQAQLQQELQAIQPKAKVGTTPGGGQYLFGFTNMTEEQKKRYTEINKELTVIQQRINTIGIEENKQNELYEYRERLLHTRSESEREYLKNKIEELQNEDKITKSLSTHAEKIKEMIGIYTVAYGNIADVISQNATNQAIGGTGGTGGMPVGLRPVGQKPGVDLKDYYQKRQQQEKEFISMNGQFFTSVMNDAWDQVFGHANSVAEKMFQSWFNYFSSKLATKGITSLLKLIPGVGDFLDEVLS